MEQPIENPESMGQVAQDVPQPENQSANPLSDNSGADSGGQIINQASNSGGSANPSVSNNQSISRGQENIFNPLSHILEDREALNRATLAVPANQGSQVGTSTNSDQVVTIQGFSTLQPFSAQSGSLSQSSDPRFNPLHEQDTFSGRNSQTVPTPSSPTPSSEKGPPNRIKSFTNGVRTSFGQIFTCLLQPNRVEEDSILLANQEQEQVENKEVQLPVGNKEVQLSQPQDSPSLSGTRALDVFQPLCKPSEEIPSGLNIQKNVTINILDPLKLTPKTLEKILNGQQNVLPHDLVQIITDKPLIETKQDKKLIKK